MAGQRANIATAMSALQLMRRRSILKQGESTHDLCRRRVSSGSPRESCGHHVLLMVSCGVHNRLQVYGAICRGLYWERLCLDCYREEGRVWSEVPNIGNMSLSISIFLFLSIYSPLDFYMKQISIFSSEHRCLNLSSNHSIYLLINHSIYPAT